MNEEFLNEAIKESNFNEINNYSAGGPFGAVIVKDDEIIARAHNSVIVSHDPTAHAEINAIRMATEKLGTHDLSGCEIYVNAEPCPMCLSAIIWSNIKTVYYANSAKEAAQIGFRDDSIYNFIKSDKKDTSTLNLIKCDSEEAKNIFTKFKENPNKITY